jgi:hypothetical protein
LPLAVLIIAGESDADASDGLAAMLPVVGQTLLEYQVRLARGCGGGHIVVLVEQLPAAMVEVFDRMRSDGIDVDVARDAHDAADRIHPDETVLLFTPGLIARKSLVDELVICTEPTLVTLPDQPDHIEFERIDAADRWAGLALLSGQTVRETAAMLGDWSISSTLMRNALQAGANRARRETRDGLAIVTNKAEADAMSAQLVRDSQNDDHSFFSDSISQPLARLAAPHLLRFAVPIDLIVVMPPILVGAALLLAMTGWFATGFVLLLLASLGQAIAAMLLSAAVRSSRLVDFLSRAKPWAFYAMLAAFGWTLSVSLGDWTALLLASWGISTFLLRRPLPSAKPALVPSVESGAFVMLLSTLFGAPMVGLIILLCHGLTSQIADRYFSD